MRRSEDVGRSLIGGDFNSKSPEWDEARLDRRGILVGEMVTRNDLTVLNQGRQFTFRRVAGGSIIDLTIVAHRIASRISNWSVIEVITLSDHRCIKFDLEQQCQAVDKVRGRERRSPSWNARRVSRERLREHFEETRLIDELGWVCPAGSFEAAVRSVRQKVVVACDYSMPRHKRRQAKGSMYWWNDQLRRERLAARRKSTRSKGDAMLPEAWKGAKAALRRGINKSRL